MSERIDPDTSAVERMLRGRTRQTLSPALRTRVLAAVDDVLVTKVPATPSGRDTRRHDPQDASSVAVTFFFLLATALSLLIIVAVSSEAASRRIGDTTERPLLSFAQRAEAAGITLDVMPPSTVQLAGGMPDDTDIPRHRLTLHVLDTRSFLQGDL